MNPAPDAKNVAQILPDRSSKKMSGSRFETPRIGPLRSTSRKNRLRTLENVMLPDPTMLPRTTLNRLTYHSQPH
jgi:hypothetical protein